MRKPLFLLTSLGVFSKLPVYQLTLEVEEVGIINETRARLLTFKEKVYLQKVRTPFRLYLNSITQRLFKYTGPLFLVYFAEYFINNALAPSTVNP